MVKDFFFVDFNFVCIFGVSTDRVWVLSEYIPNVMKF